MENLKSNEKGISRTSDGFLIRIYRRGKTISQHVAFGKHLDEEAALQAALIERGKLEMAHPAELRQGRQPSVGYTFTRGASGTGMKMPCWQVVYYVNDQRKTKRFYIHKYDDPHQAKLDAYQFAKEHRKGYFYERN